MIETTLRRAVLFALVSLPALGTAGAQPCATCRCVTCRTESCPDKPGLSDWCGVGKDPNRQRPRPARPGGERLQATLLQKAPGKAAPPKPEPQIVAPPPATPSPAEAQLAPAPPPRPPTLEQHLDLTLRKLPVQGPARQAPAPLYKRWWLWAAVGAVAAGGALAGVLSARPWALSTPAEVHDLRGKL